MRYSDIDPKIRSLVNAINNLGVRTYASCEGHLDEDRAFHRRRHSHPWVTFHLEGSEILDPLIAAYNRTSQVQWERSDRYFRHVLEPSTYRGMCIPPCSTTTEQVTQKKLNELHISADELARFLLENASL